MGNPFSQFQDPNTPIGSIVAGGAQSPQVVTNPDGSTTTTLADGTIYTQKPDGSTVAGGYTPVTPGNDIANASAAAGNLRDQFSQMAKSGSGAVAPTVTAPTLNTTQGDQARALQMGGAGVQASGIPVVGAGIGTEVGATGVQGAGLSDQAAARGTLGAAGQSYRDVLSGAAPSVAQLQGEQQAGQNVAAQFGAAAGATGANRALALRTAMNNSGGLNAQEAAQAAILRATEQNAARTGLANVGTAQGGIGNNVTATGTAIGNTGNNIVSGGNTLAGIGSGISTTGANIRTGDTDIAKTNAANDLAGQTTNAANGVTTTGQDLTFKSNMAGAANTAAGNNVTAASSREQAAENQAAANGKSIGQEVSNKLGISSEQVKADVRPAASQQVADLFATLNKATSAAPAGALPGSLIKPSGGGGSSLFGDISGAAGLISPASKLASASGLMGGAGEAGAAGDAAAAGGAAGLAGEAASLAPLAAASSKKVKTNVRPSPDEARAMFAQITPTTWAYKPDEMAKRGLPMPDTESPKHLGVIAEQVEKAGPLGKGMVTQVNGTKAIDIPMAVSALMAAMADIEKQVTSKRKGATRG